MSHERNNNNGNQSGNKPLVSFRDGGLSVAIWKKQQDGRDLFNLSLRKNFRKGDDWQEQTLSLFPGDAAKALCLLAEGYRFVTSQERLAA